MFKISFGNFYDFLVISSCNSEKDSVLLSKFGRMSTPHFLSFSTALNTHLLLLVVPFELGEVLYPCSGR